MPKEKLYSIKKTQKLPGSITELNIEIQSLLLEKKWPEAVKHLNEHVNLPGFRKGHIPEKTLISQIGEMTILEESAELALKEIYPDIIAESKLNPIGSPNIVITKIARGNPLELTLRISLIPEVKLGNYNEISKKIMGKKEDIVVDDKEVLDVINEIKKYRSKDAPETKDEKELTDEFIKTLGDFKDVADFKQKIKENLSKEKEFKLKEKKRIETIEAIRGKSEIDVPDVLVQSELDRMIHEFSYELSRMGGTFEKYLSEIKKTEEELKNEWKEKALNRVKNELILFEIAKLEKIEPNKSEVEKETEHMKEHYPDTPSERIAAYVEDMLTKEEVFKFFENTK